MRNHNPLRLRGISPSFTYQVRICCIRTYDNPCKFPVNKERIITRRVEIKSTRPQRGATLLLGPSLTRRVVMLNRFSILRHTKRCGGTM